MLALLLISLCAWRLARLLTKDEFPPILMARQRVLERWGPHSWQGYLVECPVCMGVWSSAAVTAALVVAVGLPAPWLYWGAGAALVVLINDVEHLVDHLAGDDTEDDTGG